MKVMITGGMGVIGAETTRNSVAGGLLALAEHPDQLCSLRADLELLPAAVEEMVRWTSPSPSKRRTAARDVTLAGHAIRAGQKWKILTLKNGSRLPVYVLAGITGSSTKPYP